MHHTHSTVLLFRVRCRIRKCVQYNKDVHAYMSHFTVHAHRLQASACLLHSYGSVALGLGLDEQVDGAIRHGPLHLDGQQQRNRRLQCRLFARAPEAVAAPPVARSLPLSRSAEEHLRPPRRQARQGGAGAGWAGAAKGWRLIVLLHVDARQRVARLVLGDHRSLEARRDRDGRGGWQRERFRSMHRARRDWARGHRETNLVS